MALDPGGLARQPRNQSRGRAPRPGRRPIHASPRPDQPLRKSKTSSRDSTTPGPSWRTNRTSLATNRASGPPRWPPRRMIAIAGKGEQPARTLTSGQETRIRDNERCRNGHRRRTIIPRSLSTPALPASRFGDGTGVQRTQPRDATPTIEASGLAGGTVRGQARCDGGGGLRQREGVVDAERTKAAQPTNERRSARELDGEAATDRILGHPAVTLSPGRVLAWERLPEDPPLAFRTSEDGNKSQITTAAG